MDESGPPTGLFPAGGPSDTIAKLVEAQPHSITSKVDTDNGIKKKFNELFRSATKEASTGREILNTTSAAPIFDFRLSF